MVQRNIAAFNASGYDMKTEVQRSGADVPQRPNVLFCV